MNFNMFDWIMLAMGLYVLVAGIRGKGNSLYNMERIKEGCAEKLKKTLRKSYLGLGAVMTLNAVSSLVKNTFYTYQEVAPATETEKAVYEWVQARELGAFAFLTPKALDIVSYVCIGLCMAMLALLFVIIRKYTDKNAKPAANGQGQAAAGGRSAQAGHILPVSAFDFDDAPADAAQKTDGE